MIVLESGSTKRTHLALLYNSDTLVNPDTYIVIFLTIVLILGFSGGPLCGMVSCLPAPHSLNPTRFLLANRKSYVVVG